MNSATTAMETLEILWNNYLTLCEQVDLEAMPPETLHVHMKHKSPIRPFRIASWVARQGCFISMWALWEYYSVGLCESLTNKLKKVGHESTVDWVGKSLAANGIEFVDQGWFSSANCLRNLIAHYGAHVACSKAKGLLERCQSAFPGIGTWKDGYVDIEYSHPADLKEKIEDFIDNTAGR